MRDFDLDEKLFPFKPPTYGTAVAAILCFLFIAGCSFSAAAIGTGYFLIEQGGASHYAFAFAFLVFVGCGLFMSQHFPQGYRSNIMGCRGKDCNATVDDIFVVVALGWIPPAILGVFLMSYGFPG